MAKIIQFHQREQPKVWPEAESNGYSNLTRLIAIADTAESLNFFMESIGELERNGYLLEGEAEKLTEQGRARRLEMSKPQVLPKEDASKPGVYSYTPEMGGQKPDCQMEASRSYYGGHWYIDTPLEIKGRGITFLKKYEDSDFCKPGNYRVGWNEYRVTDKAFEKLKTQYSISHECLLD
ncbi:MAG: hypothetical protein LIO94_06900 [Clostridiales bacterium]|nr:hypothetical protein [Clostridiales bacterium]